MPRVVFAFLCLVFLALLVTIALFSIGVVFVGVSSYCDWEAAETFYRQNESVSDIVLTLTTIPSRISTPTFQRVVASFLTQTRRLQEIRINVPHVCKRNGETYVIPEWLDKSQCVTIVRCEDEGPATKYLATIRHFAQSSNQRILVCDDDMILPSHLVETFDKLPREGVVWTTVGEILKHEDGKWVKARTILSEMTPDKKLYRAIIKNVAHWEEAIEERTKVHVVLGTGGYLLEPSMVDLTCLEDYRSMPKSAFYVDDAVMSGCLQRHHTPVEIPKHLQWGKFTYQGVLNMASEFVFQLTSDNLSTSHNLDFAHDKVMWKYFEPWSLNE